MSVISSSRASGLCNKDSSDRPGGPLLPRTWLGERSFRVGHVYRKLARNEMGLTNSFDEGGKWLKRSAVMFVRIENTHGHTEFFGHNADGFSQVRIIGDEDGQFEALLKGIPNQVRREIDV